MNAVFKALADPTRRHVLELLRVRPMTAGELADHFPVSKPTMSAHFAVLREADLVHVHKAGKTVVYSLKLSVLEDALLGFVGAFSTVAAAARPPEPAAKPVVLKKGTPS
jgi:DNA-binding transcriptional ArsR family regulator